MGLIDTGLIRPLAGRVRVLGGGGMPQLGEVADWLRRSSGPVHAEVFKHAPSQASDAMKAVAREGRLFVVADDSLVGRGHITDVIREGAFLRRYGRDGVDSARESAWVLHSKVWSTPDHAVISTASPTPLTERQLNVTFMVEGEAAAAMNAATRAAYDADPAAILAAGQRAARAGVLVNDPMAGAMYIDDAMGEVIDGAKHRLELVLKEFKLPDWAHRLVARQRAGVDVSVVTREIDDESARILREGGVRRRQLPFSRTPVLNSLTGTRLHFNSVIADDRVGVVGTRYLWMPSRPGEKLAREVGVYLEGQALADARDAIREHVDRSHVDVLRGVLLRR